MSTVARNLKPIGEYQVWTEVDITNGDVLGIYESLGNRSAHTVTITSVGGDTTLRLNVIRQVYQQYNHYHESWVGVGQGTGRGSSPLLLGEVLEATPVITVKSGTSQTWSDDEIGIKDLQVVAKAPSLTITVT